MKSERKKQGGGYSRGRGKLKCYACGEPTAKHEGLGPCLFFDAKVATVKGMELARETERTNYI